MLKKVVSLSLFLLGMIGLSLPLTTWADWDDYNYSFDLSDSNIDAYWIPNIPLPSLDLGMPKLNTNVELTGYDIGLALSKSPDNYDNAENAASLIEFMLIMKERQGYMHYDRSDEKINKFLRNLQVEFSIDKTRDVDNFRVFYRGKSGEEILLLAGNDFTKTIKTSKKYPQDYGVFYIPVNSGYPGSDMVGVRTPDGTFRISRTWDATAEEWMFPIIVEELQDTFQQDSRFFYGDFHKRLHSKRI